MDIIQICYMVTISIIAAAGVVTHYFERRLIQAYKETLDEEYKRNDEVLEYCLVYIHNKAVENEDYETAQRCLTLINELKKINVKR